MNVKKLGLILILGGTAVTLLSMVWFAVAYAEAMDFVSRYGGADMGSKLIACLYSSPAICQGAGFLSDAPSYSPVVFWIGAIALITGVIVRLSLKKQFGESSPAGSTAAAGGDGSSWDILNFIPQQKYTRTTYILMLTAAVGGLLLAPLAIIGFVGFTLGLLGLFVVKPRLSALDNNHLAALSVVFPAAAVLLLLTRGNFLFLLIALVQIALFYIGFNSFRHARTIGIGNLKDEALFAVKPVSQQSSNDERH